MPSRTNTAEEPGADVDPQQQALAEVMGILMPVRERRTLSLDSQCREAQQRLVKLQQAIGQAEKNCQEQVDEQQYQRSALIAELQGQALSFDSVVQWQRREHALLSRQAELRLQVQRLYLELDEQQQYVEKARERLRASQRALEKLACWRDALI